MRERCGFGLDAARSHARSLGGKRLSLHAQRLGSARIEPQRGEIFRGSCCRSRGLVCCRNKASMLCRRRAGSVGELLGRAAQGLGAEVPRGRLGLQARQPGPRRNDSVCRARSATLLKRHASSRSVDAGDETRDLVGCSSRGGRLLGCACALPREFRLHGGHPRGREAMPLGHLSTGGGRQRVRACAVASAACASACDATSAACARVSSFTAARLCCKLVVCFTSSLPSPSSAATRARNASPPDDATRAASASRSADSSLAARALRSRTLACRLMMDAAARLASAEAPSRVASARQKSAATTKRARRSASVLLEAHLRYAARSARSFSSVGVISSSRTLCGACRGLSQQGPCAARGGQPLASPW